MGSTHPSQRRYPPELRERAVRMARDAIAEQGGQSFGVVPRIAKQLGVGVESLRGWLKQADIDAGVRPGTSSEDAAKIAELEREVRDLRRANDILKAASIFMPMARLCRKRWPAVAVGAGQPGRGGSDVSA
jgi:transposase